MSSPNTGLCPDFSNCQIATDFSAIEAFGYTVTASGDPGTPYTIAGPRNVRYALMRNVKSPTSLFAIYDRPGHFGVAKIKGHEWFTDRDGVLRPA